MTDDHYEKAQQYFESLIPRLIKAFGWHDIEEPNFKNVMFKYNHCLELNIAYEDRKWLSSTCSINKVPRHMRTKVQLVRIVKKAYSYSLDAREPTIKEREEKPFWIKNRKLMKNIG